MALQDGLACLEALLEAVCYVAAELGLMQALFWAVEMACAAAPKFHPKWMVCHAAGALIDKHCGIKL